MILESAFEALADAGKPRACGDDPDIREENDKTLT